jgi:hypothetical protein
MPLRPREGPHGHDLRAAGASQGGLPRLCIHEARETPPEENTGRGSRLSRTGKSIPPKAGTVSSFPCSPCMSPRSDMYRQRATDAKNRAAQTNNPHVKSAFKEVARGWLLLAEQMEWMDRQEEAKEGDAPRAQEPLLAPRRSPTRSPHNKT